MKLVSFIGTRGAYKDVEVTPHGVTFRKGEHELLVPAPAAIIEAAKKVAGELLLHAEDYTVFSIAKGVVRANPSTIMEGALWANDEHVVYITVKGWCDQDPVELILRPDELWAVKTFRPSQVTLSWQDLQFILQQPYLLRDDEENEDED